MYKDKRIIAIIPARGGSKGIPGKNIKSLMGKPLIAYSIECALESKYIDRVVVSTDASDIAEVAKTYGAWVPFLRPAKYATDTSKTIDSLIYTIDTLREQGDEFDYLVLLQPTQPIRTAPQLDEAIELTIDNNYPSLVSVCPVCEHPILMRTITNDGSLKNLLNISSTVRRQDFPNVYKVNGSIYINQLNDSFNSNTSLNDNLYPYVMTAKESIDIDTIEDFAKAEEYIINLGKKEYETD